MRLVGECETAHTRCNVENVVVDCKHLLEIAEGSSLECNVSLGVIDAREIARAGWLEILGLDGEGIHVDTGVRVAGVIVEGLDLVVVLAVLLLHTVRAVEHQLELVQGTHLQIGKSGGTLLSPGVVHAGGTSGATQGVGVDEGIGAGEDEGRAQAACQSEGVGADEQ